MKHKVRPYWEIKNSRISRKRRWYTLFEAWSFLKQRTPNYSYHSHNTPKGTVVYSYNETMSSIRLVLKRMVLNHIDGNGSCLIEALDTDAKQRIME